MQIRLDEIRNAVSWAEPIRFGLGNTVPASFVRFCADALSRAKRTMGGTAFVQLNRWTIDGKHRILVCV